MWRVDPSGRQAVEIRLAQVSYIRRKRALPVVGNARCPVVIARAPARNAATPANVPERRTGECSPLSTTWSAEPAAHDRGFTF
jgi:hypothetical protein